VFESNSQQRYPIQKSHKMRFTAVSNHYTEKGHTRCPATRIIARPRWRRILSGWWPEMLSCAVSIISTISLVFVLRNYNNNALPQWPLGLTLNTLIAFLATVSRSTFIIPVNECVSQSKWLWFRRNKPLKDFQTFDEASRGPWGSLKLVFASQASYIHSRQGICYI
jgi:hypothetical protein